MEDDKKNIPCGGCGAKSDNERCIGCFHDFGTEESKLLINSYNKRN